MKFNVKKYALFVFPMICSSVAGLWYRSGMISLELSAAIVAMLAGTGVCLYYIGKMEK